jgi:hypothetical protein
MRFDFEHEPISSATKPMFDILLSVIRNSWNPILLFKFTEIYHTYSRDNKSRNKNLNIMLFLNYFTIKQFKHLFDDHVKCQILKPTNHRSVHEQ